MKVNFLTGDLIFRDHKTGVHLVHEKLFQYLMLDESVEAHISLFRTKQKFYKNYASWIKNANCSMHFSNFLTRLLLYFIPVKYLFGDADVYFCDGIIPITNKKKLCIVHDLMVYKYPGNYSLIRKLYLKCYFANLRRADQIIAVSESTKQDIIKILKIPSKKIIIVNPGFECNKNKTSMKNAELVLPDKYLFYIGDARENKNLDNAIRGFAKYLALNKNDIKLIIAGGGDKTKLVKLVEDLNLTKNVIFIGYVTEEEKEYLYKNAWAFYFVSYYEGFGIPILEAMNYGVPVITSNVSSMKEIATGYAVLVEPLSINSISQGIAELDDIEKRQDYIARGKVCAQRYSWNNSYKQFKKALEKCVN